MHLKVLIPFQVFLEQSAVLRIVADTREGSYGLLPQRLDCVAALAPGILFYETAEEGECFLAVDEGVLVKTGREVLVSVRRALVGKDLHELRNLVAETFLTLDQQELRVRSINAKLEAGFLRRLAIFKHE